MASPNSQRADYSYNTYYSDTSALEGYSAAPTGKRFAGHMNVTFPSGPLLPSLQQQPHTHSVQNTSLQQRQDSMYSVPTGSLPLIGDNPSMSLEPASVANYQPDPNHIFRTLQIHYDNILQLPLEDFLFMFELHQLFSRQELEKINAHHLTTQEKREAMLDPIVRHVRGGNLQPYIKMKDILGANTKCRGTISNLESQEKSPCIQRPSDRPQQTAQQLPPQTWRSPSHTAVPERTQEPERRHIQTVQRPQPPTTSNHESPEIRALTKNYENLAYAMPYDSISARLISLYVISLREDEPRISALPVEKDRNTAVLKIIFKALHSGNTEKLNGLIAALNGTRTYAYLAKDLLVDIEKFRQEDTRQQAQKPRLQQPYQYTSEPRASHPKPSYSTAVTQATGDAGDYRLAIMQTQFHSSLTLTTPPDLQQPAPPFTANQRTLPRTSSYDTNKHDRWLDQKITEDDLKKVAWRFDRHHCQALANKLDLPYSKYAHLSPSDAALAILDAHINSHPDCSPFPITDRNSFLELVRQIERRLYLTLTVDFQQMSQRDEPVTPQHMEPPAPHTQQQTRAHTRSTYQENQTIPVMDNYGEVMYFKPNTLPLCEVCHDPLYGQGKSVAISDCGHTFHTLCTARPGAPVLKANDQWKCFVCQQPATVKRVT